ncbi:MAG: type II toxin-antitoxin system PemK/MazF family toxin [Bacteroidota bacterium]
MRYKIVLVPFPFDDLTSSKVRPAICLTDRISSYQHIVIAFITSQIQKANESSDVIIMTSHQQFSMTGLKVDSAIRLHRLVTIPERILLRHLGTLPTDFHNELDHKLRLLFSL